MYGYANFDDKTVVFSFEENMLSLLLNTIPQIEQTSYLVDNMALPKDTPYVIGYDFSSCKRYIFFVDNIPSGPYLSTIITMQVSGYIKYESVVSAISGMSFYGKEIEHFYPLNKGYTISIQHNMKVGEVKTIPYENTTDSFSFHLGEDEIICILGVEAGLRSCHTNPIFVKSRLQLKFSETTSYEKLFDLYRAVLTFLSFITYRKNIDIAPITLYGKTEYSEFAKIGTLYYVLEPNTVESDKVIEEIITYELIKPHIGAILDEIVADTLYIQHIPESKNDRNRITPARFVLTTAAFEWNVRNVYNIPTSKKLEIVKNDLLEAIKELPEKKSYNRKLQGKYDFFVQLISNMDTNLAGKIAYVLNDLNPILEIFIKDLYHLNNQEPDLYTKMGERLQKQRNNYAHGNIDKELDIDVILDIIVLEWVNYAMVFKKFNYTEKQIIRLINGIFNCNFYISDDEY